MKNSKKRKNFMENERNIWGILSELSDMKICVNHQKCPRARSEIVSGRQGLKQAWTLARRYHKNPAHRSCTGIHNKIDIRYYFLKKSGILIDCSFTLLVGVLGVSSVGVVPPTGLLTAGPFELSFAAAPKSILGAVCGCA